ncbi:hypothetical protein CAEBREN_06187 [Caenorhabditis brenneri]|uniref:Uncharacterized protein n=1 Tax=Caenorhabditis brenneri TaxID=135651 RepID=G0NQG5_CAEBE|nr:hypothetical protein CAEBREN_06187 [Caenorhabditis brenneri]
MRCPETMIFVGENIKTLIGMDEICYHGCEECTKIPQKCLEYGPVRIKNLRESFVKPRFFEKLIIVDYFLDNIANVCVKSSTTKEACLNAVENLINSNVTCKTLVLKISETRKAETRETTDVYRLEFNTDKLRPMPREVLETILRKWKVQSVVLKFIVETHKKKQAGAWISRKWFSELCLNDDYRNVKQSRPELKISEVCVDLKDSYKCANSLQVREPYRRVINKYGYTVVSNVRRVFLCDKLSIECSHWYQRLKIPIADGVRRLMKVVTMEDQDNLEVNIRIFPTHRNSEEFFNGLIERQGSNPDIYQGFTILTLPSPLPVFPRSLEPIKKKPYYKFEKTEWIGNAFRMINSRKELVINWEFMIEKKEPIKMSNNLRR